MAGLGHRPPQPFETARAESLRPKVVVPNAPTNHRVSTRPDTYTLLRGPDMRPLQFEGQIVGEVERDSGKSNAKGLSPVHRAAIYRTRGGKYVSEFSTVDSGNGERTGKADVFGTLNEACDWFRPGPLTTELLKRLGRWEPEIIE